MNSGNFFAELKRRNVYKVAVAYAVIAWLLIQAASILFPTFEAPAWVMKVFVVIIAAGFVVALVVAWAFEMTPQGMKRTENVGPDEVIPQWSPRKFAALIIVVAIGAMALLAYQLVGTSRWAVRPGENDGRRSAASLPEVPQKSIAVLPFENLSSDKENSYFAQGIQDEILARLSKIGDLKVISRTSTRKYQSAPDNLREIAQQLGVANILEGSVQKAGDQVRVTVQLINAIKDDHLWADTFDRKMIDIFSVESDIAQKIAASLEAKLTGREKSEIGFIGTKNPQAYDAFLHALALRGSQRLEDPMKQRDFLENAVALDPNYAQAWAFLGSTEASIYFFPDHTEARKEKARTAVETALHLAPDLAEAHASMGIYNYYCLRDYEAALAELGIAREHAPNDGNIAFFTSLVQRRQGKFDDCIGLMEQAAVLDPLNEDIPVNLGRTYRGMRRFDEARAMFDRALAIAPDDVQVLCLKAETYLAQGDADTAWRMIGGLKIPPSGSGYGTYLTLLALRRQFDELIAGLSSAMEQKEMPSFFRLVAPAVLASLHLAKGDREGALSLRAQAEEGRKSLLSQKLPGAAQSVFIHMEARFGDREAVERDLKNLFAETEKDRWEFPNSETTAAIGYSLLGDFDRALPFLQDALERPSDQSITAGFLRLDPVWDSVRGDPRFQKLANAK